MGERKSFVREAIGYILWRLSQVGLYEKPYWGKDASGNPTCGYGRLHHLGYREYPVIPLENKAFLEEKGNSEGGFTL